MSDDTAPADDEGEGAPAWVMTFADLMSLLMCFFVLLLSFSEMDLQKYKQVAGSMKFAFGVQRKIKAEDKVKGTSMIADEYAPGQPKPTLQRVLQQETTDDSKENVKGDDGEGAEADEEGEGKGEGEGESDSEAEQVAERRNQSVTEAEADRLADEQMEALLEELKKELDEGALEIERHDEGVIVKIREKGSFPSGEATLDDRFKPVLAKVMGALTNPVSKLIVSGHTDDVPIKTARYPSNWVLSAARASSVVNALIDLDEIDPARLEIRGHADTMPVAPNDSRENRAKNRRVEILISNKPGQKAPDKIVMDATKGDEVMNRE